MSKEPQEKEEKPKKKKKLMDMLRGLDIRAIQERAEIHDEVTVAILESVNEMRKNQQKIMRKIDKINEVVHWIWKKINVGKV